MMEKDLFESSAQKELSSQPLAYRMRPRTLDEYIGQQHIIGPGKLLRRAIQADRLSSVIFYGPPGTGKTTLASVIANTTRSAFATMNAVLSGVKELRYEIDEAKRRLELYSKRTILFVDEVHRWNKSQQDALLPWVENGTIIFIGATTENPFFEVNAALVSRSRIFQLKSLTDEDLFCVAHQAVEDEERGYGKLDVKFEPGALEHLVNVSRGDARSLLNALELAVVTSEKIQKIGRKDFVLITRDAAEQSIQEKAVLYDKEGDYHFDVISAFIKSIRGSDPDAALYWLAKMVNAGEDPRFIFRRMLISACEDIGLADPYAIVVVEADASAYERIGLPEGQFHLTHSALYLATAPKSNSALGYFDALSAVKNESASAEVPNNLRDASRDAKGFGHGEGYKYPHAYKDHWVAQNYLPTSLKEKVFYHVGSIGYEQKISEEVARRREVQLESAADDEFVENLTYSPGDRQRDQWVVRATSQRSQMLEAIRKQVFDSMKFARSDRTLVLNAGLGLLVWEAFRRTPEGLVVAQVRSREQYEAIEHFNKDLDEVQKVRVVKNVEEVQSIEEGLKFERIICRNPFSDIDKADEALDSIYRLAVPGGEVFIVQGIPSMGSRLSDYVDDPSLKQLLAKAEEQIFSNEKSNWKITELEKAVRRKARLESIAVKQMDEVRIATEKDVRRWIDASYGPALELGVDQKRDLGSRTAAEVADRELGWHHSIAFIDTFAPIN